MPTWPSRLPSPLLHPRRVIAAPPSIGPRPPKVSFAPVAQARRAYRQSDSQRASTTVHDYNTLEKSLTRQRVLDASSRPAVGGLGHRPPLRWLRCPATLAVVMRRPARPLRRRLRVRPNVSLRSRSARPSCTLPTHARWAPAIGPRPPAHQAPTLARRCTRKRRRARARSTGLTIRSVEPHAAMCHSQTTPTKRPPAQMGKIRFHRQRETGPK